MYIVHVSIVVKEEYIPAFKEATIENARNSLEEVGIARFDVLQQLDDATKFLLAETYITPEDQLKHKETEHYKRWKEASTPMIAEAYTFVKYESIT